MLLTVFSLLSMASCSDCPAQKYAPEGSLVTYPYECPDDPSICPTQCGQGVCVEWSWNNIFCEDCTALKAWSNENCADCLSEHDNGLWSLTCTTQ
jgi:hypothetical protein